MAANNYFGFTHGGTQYGSQATPTAYAQQPAQPTYVQQAQPAAYAATAPPRAQTYETAYQAAAPAAAATQYTYTTRTQVVNQAAPTYDPSKAYYTPAAAAPAAPAAPAVYSVAETTYQPGAYQAAPAAVPVVAAKPAYTAPVYSAPQAIRQNTVIKPQPAVAPAVAPTYATYTGSNTTTAAATSSSYDAALYSAASSYISQQSKSSINTWQKKPSFQKTTFTKTFTKPKPQPKQAQLHYCEVCKISCAGPMTYREHLDGQKHKKKESALKAGTATITGRAPQNQLRCELCDITCTGSDAYAAHIRGAKHQKVLKLHTKLGKPIPSTQPTVVTSNSGSTSSTAGSTNSSGIKTTAIVGKPSLKTAAVVATSDPRTAIKKVIATPKITFVGAGTLKSTVVKEEVKPEPKVLVSTKAVEEKVIDDTEDTTLLPGEKEVTPVGHEYIEEVKNEFGKVVSFHCKLCECKFNDPNAKLMHMKGRRHRLQYKKKVDPSLLVEVKPSIRQRKVQEEKIRRQNAKEEYWRRRDAEERWREEMKYMMMYENPTYGYGFGRGMPVRRPESLDDRHVMAKHTSIYPNEGELLAVQSIVSSVEKALKLVSDQIAEADAPMETAEKTKEKEKATPPTTVVKKEPVTPTKKVTAKEEPKETAKTDAATAKDTKEEEKKPEVKKEEKEEAPAAPPRVLKGVMRVGVLAKGLLLHGDLNVHLVVLCSEKPTRTLLERIASALPKQLGTVTEDKYDVKICVEEAAVIVAAEKEPKTTCAITLTSPVMRDENLAEGEEAPEEKPEPPDVLDSQKCLDALAALRHAKWFQARANGLQSCVVVIRIMRDLCQRVPTWTPLSQWAMELLVEKCVSSGGSNMSPGDALRRVFECISSGIILPGGPGLYDPCEKDPTDASIGLSNQEREDITASAQHALRLIAFRQIHKVLGMDALPKFQGKRFNTRKRKATGGSESGDTEAEGKKDKKEDEEKK